MKFYTFNDFVKLVRNGIKSVSFDEFRKTKFLEKRWNSLEKDDIRLKLFKNVDEFYRFVYDFLNDNEPLEEFYDKRIKMKEHLNQPASVEVVGKQIYTPKTKNSKFYRNINLPEILETHAPDSKTLHFLYKNAIENGIIDRAFIMPSVIEKSVKKDYSAFEVTLKTICQFPSIFNDGLYSFILEYLSKLIKKNNLKILIPTASWCVPVGVLKYLQSGFIKPFSEVYIVDVIQPVLDRCKELKKYLKDNTYKLETINVPSEEMNSVLNKNYFDVVFFCPPYFNLEEYPGENQSTKRYKSYKEWLNGYWVRTVENCYKSLKSGGLFSFVVNERVYTADTLFSDLYRITIDYFQYIEKFTIRKNRDTKRQGSENLEIFSIYVKS